MTRNKILGLLCVVLLISAFMLAATTPSGYSWGDSILRALGLKAWSQESVEYSARGLHYTLFYTLGMAILGYWGAKRLLKDVYPKLFKLLPAIVLVLLLTGNQIFTWGHGRVLSCLKGVDAVDYFPALSNCIYQINPLNNMTSFSYHIELENYSNESVAFNLRVQQPSNTEYTMVDVPAQDSQDNKILNEFTLLPKEKKTLSFSIEDFHYFSGGSMNRPNLVIFNQDGYKEFNVH